MIRAGINVAIGTDSCASSPDLNVVDDLRLAYRLSKQSGHHLHSQTIWEMIMTNAARALGLQDQIGSITPGKSADFAVFEVSNTDDPLREILETSEIPIVRVISV